jgi:hypothetical protein
MNVSDLDLTQASRAYGVANTPPFLVRKLQADPGVRAIGETCKAEDILTALRSAVVAEQDSPVDSVRPYALLVALWFKPEIEHLKEAARISALPYRWFSYIAELLIQNFAPVQTQTIQVPGLLSAPSVSVVSSASTTTGPPIIIAHR